MSGNWIGEYDELIERDELNEALAQLALICWTCGYKFGTQDELNDWLAYEDESDQIDADAHDAETINVNDCVMLL